MEIKYIILNAAFLSTLLSNNLDLIKKNSLSSAFEDDDLDGVANSLDLCPNSDMLDIVDKNGCAKNQTPNKSSNLNITLSIGFSYQVYKSSYKEITNYISSSDNFYFMNGLMDSQNFKKWHEQMYNNWAKSNQNSMNNTQNMGNNMGSNQNSNSGNQMGNNWMNNQNSGGMGNNNQMNGNWQNGGMGSNVNSNLNSGNQNSNPSNTNNYSVTQQVEKKDINLKIYYYPISLFIVNKAWNFSITTGFIKLKDTKTTSSIADTTFEVGYTFKPIDGYILALKGGITFPTSKFSSKTIYNISVEVNKSYNKHNFLIRGNYQFGLNRFFNADFDYSYDFNNFSIGTTYSINRNITQNLNNKSITIYTNVNIYKNYNLIVSYDKSLSNSKFSSFSFLLSRSF